LGKPFHAVAACVMGAPKKGHVFIEIYDVKDFDVNTSCARLPPVPGARKLGLVLPWKEGEKLDLATLKAGKDMPEGYVMEALADKKFSRKDAGKDFKPQGTVEVLRAGTAKGDVGRIRVTLTAGKEQLQGEVDVDVMADVGESWKQ
jgi:hypothetical protein